MFRMFDIVLYCWFVLDKYWICFVLLLVICCVVCGIGVFVSDCFILNCRWESICVDFCECLVFGIVIFIRMLSVWWNYLVLVFVGSVWMCFKYVMVFVIMLLDLCCCWIKFLCLCVNFLKCLVRVLIMLFDLVLFF